ncbi:MAG: membrane protein [Ktedonobacteraceae bacterium]
MAPMRSNTTMYEQKHGTQRHNGDSIPTSQSYKRDILLLFVVTRLVLMAITYVGYILLTAPKYSSTAVDTGVLLTVWNHWDAANYIRIAQYGYQTRIDLAFFPLFPLLITSISHVLGSWSYLLVGTLISNGALLGVLVLLHQLARETVGEQVARRTVLYLCIFPTTFYFFAAYNESLFLVFVISAWLAGILGFLAALTRSAGILLVLPYLYELWQERTQITKKSLLFGILPIALILSGTGVYSVYCWLTVGNPLAFVTVQDTYGRHLSWPWQGLWQGITALLLAQPFGSANQAHLLLDLSATIGFLLLAVLGWRKLPVSYSLWVGILFLYILLDPALDKPDILLSNQRFVLEMFPAFITLALLGLRHPRLHQTCMIIFPTLLATLSILFVMNRWLV